MFDCRENNIMQQHISVDSLSTISDNETVTTQNESASIEVWYNGDTDDGKDKDLQTFHIIK